MIARLDIDTYFLGARAFWAGELLSANPWFYGSASEAWERGWLDARDGMVKEGSV